MSEDFTHWPSGIRDTTEFPVVNIEIGVEFREHLKAFCSLDGISWNDYNAQASVGQLTTTDQRIRTYRKMYERLGLIYKENDCIHLSRLGIAIKNLEETLNEQKQNELNRIRETAINILSRYQLKNPVDGPNLPDECDVRPYFCIWEAMSQLDNKINYEEMNRVLLRIMRMKDLPEAILKIKNARTQYGNYQLLSPEELDSILGKQVHTDQPTARIAPWFSFAAQ